MRPALILFRLNASICKVLEVGRKDLGPTLLIKTLLLGNQVIMSGKGKTHVQRIVVVCNIFNSQGRQLMFQNFFKSLFGLKKQWIQLCFIH